jgi:CheY-like chemotaxis protein
MRLLIVDDSPLDLKLLRAQLEQQGHQIVEASNGVEALQLLEHTAVDAVVSDILMPLMDGYRLCYEIRKSATANADVAVVLYTATYSSSSDRELAETLGADDYLFKPAPIAAILDAVKEAQRKSKHRQQARTTDRATLAAALEQNQKLENDVARLTLGLAQANSELQAHRSDETQTSAEGGPTRT